MGADRGAKGAARRFTVWLKRENGAWEALTRGISVGTDALKLYPQTCGLTSGTTCALQVEYPGGQTGILTFTYDVAPLKHGYSAGSRDGGGEDTYLPDIIQPSPGGSHSGGSHPSTEYLRTGSRRAGNAVRRCRSSTRA